MVMCSSKKRPEQVISAYQLGQVNVDDKFFGSCICIRIPERNHSIGFYNTENCILRLPVKEGEGYFLIRG